VVLVLTTVVSAGYYLYVIMLMFMRPRLEGAVAPERAGGMTRMVLAISVVLILILGVAPDYAVLLSRSGLPATGLTPAIMPQANASPPPPGRAGVQLAHAARDDR
jgi:NADH:ubiquinone oxidoreductase subunit 4 (subunit M)